MLPLFINFMIKLEHHWPFCNITEHAWIVTIKPLRHDHTEEQWWGQPFGSQNKVLCSPLVSLSRTDYGEPLSEIYGFKFLMRFWTTVYVEKLLFQGGCQLFGWSTFLYFWIIFLSLDALIWTKISYNRFRFGLLWLHFKTISQVSDTCKSLLSIRYGIIAFT